MTHDLNLNLNLIERVAIGDMLRRRARDSGDREALVEFIDGARVALTFGKLNQQVNQLVRGLRTQGLNQGDRLALIASNSIDFFIVAFACYKAGIVLVPVNFLQSTDDIRYTYEHAGVKCVVYEPALESVALAACEGTAQITLTVSTGSEAAGAHTTLNTLIQGQDTSEIEDVIIHDRDTAQLLYTSGTTSHPKGVETSHLSLYFTSMSNPLSMGFGRFHRHLIVLPVFHCAALSLCLATLQVCGTLILQSAYEPARIVELLQREKINGLALLPMMWKALLQVPGIAQSDFPNLNTAIYAMAPMDGDTLNQLRECFQCGFHLASGQTEFTPASCIFYDGTESEFGEGNYWGVPTIATDQAILDDKGNELPPGQEGEICWRGPQVMSGYLNNAAATAEARQFGWHHTGDLGLIDKNGQLLFVDRKKDMIKSGGENVPSCKVEQVLLSIPGIIQAAVFGVPHPHWSEAVCAGVQLAPGVAFDEAAIIEQCKKQLGGFQVPKRVLALDSFPMTATGKIKKNDLRNNFQNLFNG